MSDRHDPALSRYIALVRSLPLLDRDTEHALAVAARGGDRDAAERLVRANLRYVVSIALSYRRYSVPVSDLVSEGNLGLMIAVSRFDPDRGTRFVTYAAYWIRAYVLNAIIRAWSLVGGGSGALRSKLFFRLRRERARFANLLGTGAEALEAMARSMGLDATKVEEMTRRLDARDLSLSTPLSDGSAATLQDVLESVEESQEAQLLVQERDHRVRGRLAVALASLDARERWIVEVRLMSDEEMSLADIGRKLGVSRERARQLESRAKTKLQKMLSDLRPLVLDEQPTVARVREAERVTA
ncbi:MAG: sigma-70 family RNA polymerase sigma factor [Deltaproteobacteria bacterium]|nr:sigma-70 family RNA polymerase sigma factor [Deltaproteobacteria bacterium]